MDYDIINGKKYKKCKDNQIRNPITLRCIKIKEDKNKSNKPINKNTKDNDVINSEKYKKCKDNQIKDSKTFKCDTIKENKEIRKKSLSSSGRNKAAKVIQRFMQKGLYPFINRVSGNIYNRIYYYKKIIKILNINKTNDDKYCIVPDESKENVYYINNIKLKKQIGSESTNGIVFLASFEDKLQKIYKYAVKLTKLTKENKEEIKNFKTLSNVVINNKCPHFPIMYANTLCLSFTPNPKLPKMLLGKRVNKYGLLYMELANGDLNSMMYSGIQHSQSFYINTLVQCYLSLMFYYNYVNKLHGDSHGGNFLYHKIKSGGYFYYKILGKDYYLENIGYLWMLWDYELAISFKEVVKDNYYTSRDFLHIINIFLTGKQGGWIIKNYFINDTNNKIINELMKLISDKNYKDYINNTRYTETIINDFIKLILDYFVKFNFILTSLPSNTEVINKKPYEISGIPFKYS